MRQRYKGACESSTPVALPAKSATKRPRRRLRLWYRRSGMMLPSDSAAVTQLKDKSGLVVKTEILIR
jgi:hypothetical protein